MKSDMRRLVRIFLGLLCLAVAAVPAAAQGVLPASFAGWISSTPSTPVPLAALDPLLGPDTPAFLEYAVKSVEQRSYSQGAQSASITLYRLRDPSSAYGAYTFLRSDSLADAVLGSYAGASRERALFVVGEMVLDVSAPAKQARPSDADLKQLAGQLDKKVDHTPYPFIGEHLPEKDRIRGSERYVIGPLGLAHFVPLGKDDWMGYDYSAESILAKYQVGKNTETLIITSYPTQQVAAKKFAGILRRFVFDPPGGVQAGQNVLFGKRVSSYIAVVAGAPSRESANKILDQVGYESNVTWNEPHQSYTEPGINAMIVEAFLGTGVIMIFAVAAGIGFGGFRVLVKIFLPNKIFDREKQIEILQLGISSKPIKAKDFY
jgi:uncharacterized protein DUF6599